MKYKDTLQIIQGGNVKIEGLVASPTKITTYKYDGDEAKEIENQLKYDEVGQEINTTELNSGTYIIELYVKKGNDNVSYSFKLEVLDDETVEV